MSILTDAEFKIIDCQNRKIDSTDLKDIDGWVIRSGTKVNPDLLDQTENLKVIGRAGVGVDNIDISEATRHGVVVMNTPDSNTISAAEHSFALIAALSRNVQTGHMTLTNGKWRRHELVGVELRGKTLGVVGLGRIGREVIKRALSFDMKILGFDPFINQDMFDPDQVKVVDMDTLTENSDFITLHVPLLDSTRDLFDIDRLKKMKTTARIINVARGGIINETDLATALNEGIIAGAAIDVFTSEPIPENHPLLGAKNVLLTPHLGASTKEAKEGVSIAICEQVRDFLLNDKLSNTLNMPITNIDELNRLEPYMNLARRMGLLQSQLAKGAIRKVNMECSGNLDDTKPIILSFLKGLLENVSGSRINFVNAFAIAEERGIMIDHSYSSKETTYTNLIESFVDSDSGKIEIGGSAFSGNHLRIVNLMGYDVDFRPEGPMVFLKNKDVPGVIGKVGTLLGTNHVNIGEYHLSRSKGTDTAYAIIKVDENLKESIIEKLIQLDELLEVVPLSVD